MATAMYMKVEGATGESKDADHTGWTDVDSFTWGAIQPHSMGSGGGAGVGRVAFQDLNIVAAIDKCYPAVLKHCATGKHLGQIDISLCKAGGTQIEYGRITLTDVLVTGVTVSGTSSGETTVVNYSFQAAKVKSQYWEQTQRGGKGAESQMGFDIKQNVEA